MTKRDSLGFTLLELLIALALFALLGLACWRLLDSTLRVEQRSAEHAGQTRSLQRALAVIERDLLQARTQGGRAAIVLDDGLLNIQRGNWLNPLDQPRSDWQEVSFSLRDGHLWRHSRGDSRAGEQQRLLAGVGAVRWRVVDRQGTRHARWPIAAGEPAAVELTLQGLPVPDLQRLSLLPGHWP